MGRSAERWRKARRCTDSTCIEVNLSGPVVGVRDSKDLAADPDAPFPSIQVPADRWSMFLSEVMGESTPGDNGSIFFNEEDGGNVVLTSAESDVALTYDSDEWIAFKGGVADGDFGPLHANAL
ncbi:MAG: DUF397 domain-containing protein [Acidimicrobiales bacterium]